MQLNKKLLSERDICTKYITRNADLTNFENLSNLNPAIERELPFDQFPSPTDLWECYPVIVTTSELMTTGVDVNINSMTTIGRGTRINEEYGEHHFLSFPKEICHVAYDLPPLTRRERALNVKKRNYFTKYSEQARRVLEALLDKYADEGIETSNPLTC